MSHQVKRITHLVEGIVRNSLARAKNNSFARAIANSLVRANLDSYN